MRLVLDARARALLRRLPRVNVYSVLELLLLGILAVQCARLVWVTATPVNPLGDWQRPQPGFVGAPGDVLRGFDPFFRLSGEQGKPSTVTSLQLFLFGTRIDEANGRGSAIIETPDHIQKSYSVGDEIVPGVKLKEVAFDHVTIDRGGAAEDLFIDQSTAVAPVSTAPPVSTSSPPAANSINFGQPAASSAPSSTAQAGKDGMTLAKLRGGVGFIPRLDGGRVTGLVLRPQGSGDVFRNAGLKEGDIATAINGKPVTGKADLEQLAGSLAGGGTVSLTIERDGSVVPIAITVNGP